MLCLCWDFFFIEIRIEWWIKNLRHRSSFSYNYNYNISYIFSVMIYNIIYITDDALRT